MDKEPKKPLELLLLAVLGLLTVVALLDDTHRPAGWV
jgi:hypothetical protein